MGSFSPTARRNSTISTITRTCRSPKLPRTTASPVRGVRDVIVRAENYMTEIEDKTGLIKRFMQLQPHVEKITDAAEQIKQLNFRRYEDRQLEELAGVIEAEAAALKE